MGLEYSLTKSKSFEPITFTIKLETPEAAQEMEARMLMSFDALKRAHACSDRCKPLSGNRTALKGIMAVRRSFKKTLGSLSINKMKERY